MILLQWDYVRDLFDISSKNMCNRAEYIFFCGEKLENGKYEFEHSAKMEGLKGYIAYFLLLNSIIPISLVVTLEIVKTLQVPFMQHDVEMIDMESGIQAKCSSLTLHEELGAINYIFADKTGTLTSNVMRFHACSVGGRCYDDLKESRKEGMHKDKLIAEEIIESLKN